MIPGIAGVPVSIVGSAASLVGTGNGPAIDSRFVIRINWTLPLAGPVADIGERTDILYHAASAAGVVAAATAAGVQTVSVDRKLRKSLPGTVGLDHRGYRPNTGTVAVYDALRSGATAVYVFGFDLYATLYVGNDAPPAEIPARIRRVGGRWKHNPDKDRPLLRKLLTDPRFHPDPILRAAIRRPAAGVAW